MSDNPNADLYGHDESDAARILAEYRRRIVRLEQSRRTEGPVQTVREVNETVTVSDTVTATEKAATGFIYGTSEYGYEGIGESSNPTNLLTNGGFETDATCVAGDPTGWTDANDCYQVTDSVARPGSSGTQSYGNNHDGELECGGGFSFASKWPNAYVYQDVAWDGDATATAMAWLKAYQGSHGNWTGPGTLGSSEYVMEDDNRIHLFALDGSMTVLDDQTQMWTGEYIGRTGQADDGVSTEWHERSLTWTPPAATETLRFQIDRGDGNNDYIHPETGHTGNAGCYIDDCRLYEVAS